MSLQQVFDERLFDDARTDTARALYYVNAHDLGFTPLADHQLMQALKRKGFARIQVIGPSGAGKTSLIMGVLRDLHTEKTVPAREVLVLKVGDRPENLNDSAAVIKLVIDTLAAQDYRFSNIEDGVLREAGADQTTDVPRQETHRFGADAKVVNYSTTLTNAYEQRQFGTNAARLRHDLADVLRIVKEAGYRPVLVLDDTEKFVAPGENGTLQEDSVANLYDHGVRVLAEFEVDLVVATHPRFEEVPKVVEVRDRLGPDRIEVPRILPDLEGGPMAKILERRLERGKVETPLGEIIEASAIDALATLYHDRSSDLRSVLRIAHGAVERALERAAEGGREGHGLARIQVRDVAAEIVDNVG
jgi:molybdopterin-guanine dinucleotide biosynthesis protein